MAKETKTVQCYPSDEKVNAMVERYEAFGWELINNQRCQEYTGQTFSSDGSSTEHYSTFNKLTFTREKTSPWYGQVTDLEEQYDKLMNKQPVDTSIAPTKTLPSFGFLFTVVGIAIALVVGLSMGAGIIAVIIGVGVATIGVLLFVVYFRKKSKCKKEYKAYLSAKAEWNRTIGEEAKEIMKKAERIVNG